MRKIILVGIIVVLLISVVGCGKPEVEETTYEDFVAEYYQTKLANTLLKKKKAELEGEVARLKGRETEYIATINALNNENEALRIEVAFVKALSEPRQEELESALNTLAELQAEKHQWHILAKKEYEAILAKYNAIEALYPPAHFTDKDELVKWRASSGNMSDSGCLGLQRRAIEEGYIVSLHQSFDYCVVVAGDYLYKIVPEDNKLVEKIGKVE